MGGRKGARGRDREKGNMSAELGVKTLGMEEKPQALPSVSSLCIPPLHTMPSFLGF